MLRRATPERLSSFSDGVFAVLITVLVLELRPPEAADLRGAAGALADLAELRRELSVHRHRLDQSPLSHALCRGGDTAPAGFNFAHLFPMSLLPLSTAWMAVSDLAPQPVAFYAAVFCVVNATYVCLIRKLVERVPATRCAPTVRGRPALPRSIATFCLFGIAARRGAGLSARRARHLHRLPDRYRATHRAHLPLNTAASSRRALRPWPPRSTRRGRRRSGETTCEPAPCRPRRSARRAPVSVCAIGPTAIVLEITTMPISESVPCQASAARAPEKRPAE